jgi:hypothetical protein
VHDDSDLSIDDLMARVRDRVLQGETEASVHVQVAERAYVYTSQLDAASIEALLYTARRMTMIRTAWPKRLWIFPFNASPRLRRWFLRLFAFIFNDQRHVNLAVIEAVREQLQITKEVHGLIASLQSEVARLEGRLRSMEEGSETR